MNRRGFMGFLAGLPFVGGLVRSSPSVADSAAKGATRRLYASAGETVTCENGHAICDLARDVFVGDLQNPAADFENWRMKAPAVGAYPIPGCEKCGAPFTNGVVYHIGSAWRTI